MRVAVLPVCLMSDSLLRDAARLLRSGAPVEVLVDALDEPTGRRLASAWGHRKERRIALANAEKLAAGPVSCRYSGSGDKGATHAVVHDPMRGRIACGGSHAFSDSQPFLGNPTCRICLKALAAGSVALP